MSNSVEKRNLKQTIGLWSGLAVAVIILLFTDLDPQNTAVTHTAAVAILMAIWWITEAIPIPVTALLPVALFPLLGIMDGRAVASTYFNNIIFLFIGGFIIALAMQAKVMDVVNAPGEKIMPGEIAKGLKILAEGGDIDYVGATNVEFNDVGETNGSYKEQVIKDGKYEVVKIH